MRERCPATPLMRVTYEEFVYNGQVTKRDFERMLTDFKGCRCSVPAHRIPGVECA